MLIATYQISQIINPEDALLIFTFINTSKLVTQDLNDYLGFVSFTGNVS
jgi:hypothetical protein